MSWLITGGCGFVGSNLADELLARGEQVVVVDSLRRIGSADNLMWLRARHGAGWRFEQFDVRDSDRVTRLVAELCPGVIAHLAGQVAMTTSVEDPRLDFEINAGGTINVLEAVRLRSPESIVLFSSTNKVYGPLETLMYHETPTRYVVPTHPDGFDESLALEGSTPYGCSKLAAEQYTRDYFRMFGMRTVVFRHSSIYGEHQFPTFDQGWVGWFCTKAFELKHDEIESFTISGTGKQVRDVLHTEDLVRAYFVAAERIGDTAGEIFNLGGGMANSLSLLELFARLESLVGCRMAFTRLDRRKADQKVFVAENRKATRCFGWAPGVSAAAGLGRMVAWISEIRDRQRAGRPAR